MPAGFRLGRILVAVLVLTLAGCSADGRPTTADDDAPAPTATSSRDAGGSPPECAPPRVCNGPLVPGEYESTSIGPTIRFTVGEDWLAGADLPGEGFFLQDRSQRAPAAMTVMPFPGEVFADPCEVGTTQPAAPGSEAAVGWLTDQPFLDVRAQSEVTVGDRPALLVEAEVAVAGICEDPVVYLWPLPESTEFHLNDAEQVRFLLVDVGDQTLAIVLEAFPDADVEGFFSRAQEVLDTVSFAD